MTEHTLKTLEPYWDAIAEGRKNFEVRRDDRGFQCGDVLVLRRLRTEPPWKGQIDMIGYGLNAKPRELRRRITYVLTGGQFGVEPGYIVMGLTDD